MSETSNLRLILKTDFFLKMTLEFTFIHVYRIAFGQNKKVHFFKLKDTMKK